MKDIIEAVQGPTPIIILPQLISIDYTILGMQLYRGTMKKLKSSLKKLDLVPWDAFWISTLCLFCFSVIPGLIRFASRQFPNHWVPTSDSMTIVGAMSFETITLNLYETAGYGIVTPLLEPMPFYFFFHVLFACIASVLLVGSFITGRIIRRKKLYSEVDYVTASDLHTQLAKVGSVCWLIVIVTGGFAVSILHPTLQIANYAELIGVSALFVGTVVSVKTESWVIHRFCAWGLIYSAAASVFVGASGRLLQSYTDLSAFEVKAIGYVVAFSIPIIGLSRRMLMGYWARYRLNQTAHPIEAPNQTEENLPSSHRSHPA